MLKEMCKQGKIDGNFTNHSLRAYGATEQQCTGHRSLDALRQYERTTELQHVNVSNVISNNSRPVPMMSKTVNGSPVTKYSHNQ